MTGVGATPQEAARSRPRVAVWKFSSCDGCQLTLLDCEDELLEIAEAIEIAYFLEASSATVAGPYDLSLVEGSVTTPEDVVRIREVRAASRSLVSIGACATAGGIQALRNTADVEELLRVVYATPAFLSTLSTSTPISEHVDVDFELRGCPIDKRQLVEVITAFVNRRPTVVPGHSVCIECKARANPCILVAGGIPCLGPVTHAGCGALCPSYARGCYGCFGPADTTNTASMRDTLERVGLAPDAADRLFRTFNAWAPAFRDAGRSPEPQETGP